jgi:hypothetical protein
MNTATMIFQATVVDPTRVVEAEVMQQRCLHGGVSLEEATRVRAYQKWEQAGRPEGDGVPFWLEAESELRTR